TAPNRRDSGPIALSCTARCENAMKGDRKLVVGAAIESAAGLVLACAAPLLEEEGHPLRAALSTDVDDPISKHGTRVCAALAANNHPINSPKIDRAKIG